MVFINFLLLYFLSCDNLLYVTESNLCLSVVFNPIQQKWGNMVEMSPHYHKELVLVSQFWFSMLVSFKRKYVWFFLFLSMWEIYWINARFFLSSDIKFLPSYKFQDIVFCCHIFSIRERKIKEVERKKHVFSIPSRTPSSWNK